MLKDRTFQLNVEKILIFKLRSTEYNTSFKLKTVNFEVEEMMSIILANGGRKSYQLLKYSFLYQDKFN